MKPAYRPSNLSVAIGASLMLSLAAPTMASDEAMLKRMEMLERELAALKAEMAKQQPQVTNVKPKSAASGDGFKLGGYIKMDVRHVDGDLGYQDYWRGNNPGGVDTSHTQFNAKETRINAKYTKGEVTGFVEMDFYGSNGNEVATNSTNPRLRHAFIKYGNWMVGQYWSTFTPLKAFPEALDFGGPIVGEVFVRQPQVRYTAGNFSIALENPETWGDGDVGSNSSGGGQLAAGADPDESDPDLIATYRFNGDWGEVQVGGLVRRVDQGDGGIDETAFAFNAGGRVNVGARDDIRFQVNLGESGRYVGAGMFTDIVTDPDSGKVELEETTAYTLAYRHFWADSWRSTFYYGAAEADVVERERTHWGINLIKDLAPGLSVGVELGNFSVDDDGGLDADSDYLQASWKMAL